MATLQPMTDEISNGWLHNALDQILACPYDDLKIAIATSLDAMLALRLERDAEEPEASLSRHRQGADFQEGSIPSEKVDQSNGSVGLLTRSPL